jgi:plastocyanin
MRPLLFALATCTLLVSSLSGADSAVVRGVASSGGRPKAHAVVWLEAPGGAANPASDTRKIVLDQRNLTFYPQVLAVRVGTTVDCANNDRVFHNVFSFRDGKRFDLGMYPVGTRRRVTFDQPGVSRLFCNIHPNMAAYVVAVDSPYFAVTDNDGAFTIPGVPPGTYTTAAWRPGAGTLHGTFSTDSEMPLDVRWP